MIIGDDLLNTDINKLMTDFIHKSLQARLQTVFRPEFLKTYPPGILTEGGRLSTIDLLTKLACFVKNRNNISNIKGGQRY